MPIAMGSPGQRGLASSLRNSAAAFTFTTILLSKSCPESRSRYVWVRRAKQ